MTKKNSQRNVKNKAFINYKIYLEIFNESCHGTHGVLKVDLSYIHVHYNTHTEICLIFIFSFFSKIFNLNIFFIVHFYIQILFFSSTTKTLFIRYLQMKKKANYSRPNMCNVPVHVYTYPWSHWMMSSIACSGPVQYPYYQIHLIIDSHISDRALIIHVVILNSFSSQWYSSLFSESLAWVSWCLGQTRYL